LFAGSNPAAKLKRTSADNRRNRFFSHQEAEALLNELTVNGHHDVSDMARLSFRCGLRASEIFKLKWGSVDFANGQIAIMDTKSGENRFAIMTKDVKALLRERFHKIDPADRNPQTLVFSRDGKPYFEMPRAFQRTVDKMGFNENITDRRLRLVFHSCRHTFASWHATAGTDFLILQKLMGHETFSMTLRYAHLAPETLQAAVTALERKQRTEKNEAEKNGAEVVTLDAYRR
jgi:integrase